MKTDTKSKNVAVKYGTRHADTKDGAAGFSPQYSGNGISGVHDTSSFDVQGGTPETPVRSTGTGTDLKYEPGKK